MLLEILQNSYENTCAWVFFLIKLLAFIKKETLACNFIKKESLAQVFFLKFCEILMNTFSYRTPVVAASDFYAVNVFYTSLALFWIFFNCHVAALSETSVLIEVRILLHLHNSSTMLIPKLQTKAFVYYIC